MASVRGFPRVHDGQWYENAPKVGIEQREDLSVQTWPLGLQKQALG